MSTRYVAPKVEVQYSNTLDNIDGFLVTDGRSARLTLRASLNFRERARGKEHLLHLMQENPDEGVYMWRVGD